MATKSDPSLEHLFAYQRALRRKAVERGDMPTRHTIFSSTPQTRRRAVQGIAGVTVHVSPRDLVTIRFARLPRMDKPARTEKQWLCLSETAQTPVESRSK